MRSLRTVILRRIWIVAAVSFLLSAGFTYYYYQTILVRQLIEDDEAKLRQTARQLQYMFDDIVKFSSTLIISDRLQTFYKDFDKADTFGKFALLDDTISYVNDNRGLRKEVRSFTFVLRSGEVFWSEARFDDYFKVIMKEPWYTEYAGSGHTYMFTEPHMMIPNGNTSKKSKTISLIVKIRDIQSPGREIGELILNLDYAAFEAFLDLGSADFDGFLWTDDEGRVLYERGGMASAGDASAGGGGLTKERIEGTNWSLAAFTGWRTMMERGKIVIYLLAVFSLTSTALILLLMMPAIFRITKPIMQLYHATNAVSNGNLQASVSIHTGDELEKLGQGFNRMIEQLRLHLEESIRHEQEKREMELELLLSQLNPHFVYNTLNAVIYMAQRKGDRDIVRMVGSFIRVLQDAAKLGGGQALVPLEGEIRLLKDYVVVQSYRYTDMFDFEWHIDPAALDCLVPRYLIQPFIENAIFHGICPKDARGTVKICAAASGGMLHVTVEDDGVGMESGQLAKIWDKPDSGYGGGDAAGGGGKSSSLRRIGLSNTKKRLEHLFGGQSAIRIDSAPGAGTKVHIELPALSGAAASTT
ncbi:sensor histidine kinase [Paenibacillus alkalitolerans]|uniref:sensor histidine kinase n=1 Tax=Paenibacillus alkalitolerans TaxID=2799335 RepID=UPI0018F4171B|nr:sensor histidine kinase [Paenibacillus alkalitolerans]